jgi:hypothetical protein
MATSPKNTKDVLVNTIRNTMYRSGVVGTALKEKYSKISEEDVIQAVDSQTSIVSENNVILDSINTLATRISNNVFALAKLMQKLYEMKIKEKLLRDRERSRQEALQEETRFELEKQTEEGTYTTRRLKDKPEGFSILQILGATSLIALGFKNEVSEFLKKAETWFDETLKNVKATIEGNVNEAGGLLTNLTDAYVEEFDQEIKENKEEDLQTDNIIRDIVTELENEDRLINNALSLEDDEDVERDITDIVPRETISTDSLQPPPERTYSEPVSTEPITKPTEQVQTQPEPTPTKLQQPTIDDFIEPVNTPNLNPAIPETTSTTPNIATSPVSPYQTPSNKVGSPIIERQMQQSRMTDTFQKPSLLANNFEKQLADSMPKMASGQTNYSDSFGNALSPNVQPRAFAPPQMSYSSGAPQLNEPQIGSLIGQTSFSNRMARTYPQSSINNTTMISSDNMSGVKPPQDHYVLSPVANRGSLDIGVRFNAAN